MVQDPLRRIGTLEVSFVWPAGLPQESKDLLRKAAASCPVLRSLRKDLRVELRFEEP